jgi:hypothetical protein
VFEQLEICVDRDPQQLERGQVLRGPMGSLDRGHRFSHNPVLGAAGDLRDERVLGAEVVSRQAPASAGALADAGERCATDPAFGDDLGRGGEQGSL